MPRKSDAPGVTLDQQDYAILRILQRDNKTPQRTIAERVNLSAAAVQRRVAAMEQAGAIAANVAVVDRRKVHAMVTSIVQVHLRDERAATVDQAKALFAKHPNVQQCFYVTGGVSFILVIVARDMDIYYQIAKSLFAENDLIERYASLLALDCVKTGTEVVIG